MAAEMPEFEVPQFYETAIVMRNRTQEPDLEFRFLCAPAAAMHEESRQLLADPRALLSQFGLAEPMSLRVAQLPDAIFTLLMAEGLDDDSGPVLDLVSSPDLLARLRDHAPDAALFAEYLAFAEVVPFEQSKVTGYALATLAMTSYSAAKGITSAAPQAAIVFGPHAPVVYMAALGVASTVAVIDSIGVVVGVVTSPRTQEVLRKTRDGIRRLIHRPQPPTGRDPDDQSVRPGELSERESAPRWKISEEELRDAIRILHQSGKAPGEGPQGSSSSAHGK
jgi:hypothetical protein